MKALTFQKYGDPAKLSMQDCPIPKLQPDEVLVRVQASSLNSADWRTVTGSPFLTRLMTGIFKPKFKVPGIDVTGTIEKLGSEVEGWQVGDAVIADLSSSNFGAFAEYVCIPQKMLAKRPQYLSPQGASCLPLAGGTAFQALRDTVKLASGEHILIVGASGGVGQYAILLAKLMGAEVSALCSTRNISNAKLLGADHVVDYQQDDLKRISNQYDAILAINGKYPTRLYRQWMRKSGRMVMVGGSSVAQMLQIMAFGPIISLFGKGSFRGHASTPKGEDLQKLVELLTKAEQLSSESFVQIEKVIRLEELPEALQYMMQGHVQGKLVVEI